MNFILVRILILIYLAFSFSVFAEDSLDIQTTIESKKLHGLKNISIRLPKGYYEKQTSHVKYPTLYFLDAGGSDDHIHSEIAFLSASGVIPDLIVVGIKRDGKNRFRDFTPVKNKDNRGGGAANFIGFIEHELIPYIETNYRAADYRILQGHSLGGLFSLHTFQAKPELFQAHFAFSPSLYWADSVVTKSIEKYITNSEVKQDYLYSNLGNEGLDIRNDNSKTMRKDFIELSSLLNNQNIGSFRHKVEFFDDDPHHLTQFTGTRRALRNLFKDWFFPHSLQALGAQKLVSHYERQSNQLGYKVLPQEGTIYWSGVANIRMLGNRERALSFFKLYVELYPDSITALESLSDHYREDGELEKAIPLIKKALSILSKEEDRYLSLSNKLKELELNLN